MTRVLIAGLVALVVSIVIGPRFIEFLRRNDLRANVFLLIRHTGIRICECADLASDCLLSTGPDQWAVMCRSER